MKNMEILVIGHGSLMSGHGLSFSGPLQPRRVNIIALDHCDRGFAKLSKHGDRFATDLELDQVPLRGEILQLGTVPDGRIEGRGLVLLPADLAKLATREGYSAKTVQMLVERAGRAGLGLAEWLWQISGDCRHHLGQYRRELYRLTGYTSPHYIPHPVKLKAQGYAILFLAPGPLFGTGSAIIRSVRDSTGVSRAFGMEDAWKRKPNADQMTYFLSCLLAGVHGISVRDFLESISSDKKLSRKIHRRLQDSIEEELPIFLQTTSMKPEAYFGCFGATEASMRRSGLAEFMANHGT